MEIIYITSEGFSSFKFVLSHSDIRGQSLLIGIDICEPNKDI